MEWSQPIEAAGRPTVSIEDWFRCYGRARSPPTRQADQRNSRHQAKTAEGRRAWTCSLIPFVVRRYWGRDGLRSACDLIRGQRTLIPNGLYGVGLTCTLSPSQLEMAPFHGHCLRFPELRRLLTEGDRSVSSGGSLLRQSSYFLMRDP